MKILFVLGGLEKGADGVGDYVRRLIHGLGEKGVSSDVIALNDEFATTSRACELDEGSGARSLRLPRSIPWAERVEASRRFVQERAPDILSLQYVPFSFDPRGVSNRLPAVLLEISQGRPWHIMAHELWIDRSFPGPLRHKVLGALQKRGFRRLIGSLKPPVVHTQLEYYKQMLRGISVKSELLPLHGNIPPTSLPAEGRRWLEQAANLGKEDFVAGFFGDILPTFDLEALARFVAANEDRNRPLVLFSAGRLSGSGKSIWLRAKELVGSRASMIELGALPEHEVSRYLSGLDIGLTSYPIELAKKSGGVAAMLEHGKSVTTLGRLHRRALNRDETNLIQPEHSISNLYTAQRLIEALSRHVK